MSWFDHVEADTWSPLWFSDFAVQLDYQSNASLKIYWLLPGTTLANGLRLIVFDTDTNVMARCAEDVKNLVVYFDHEDLFSEVDWDDAAANPVSELPKVISPTKVHYVAKNPKEKLPVFYTNLDNIRVDQAADSEDDVLCDSDNEIEEGDADLFEDLITSHEKEVKDHKKAKGSKLKTLEISRPIQESDEEDTDDEGLDLPDSDGEGDVRLRFSSFCEEDMQNPTFHVGLVFPDVQKLRDAITEYSVRNRVEIKMPRNEKTRLKAHCAEGCPWNLYASFDKRTNSFMVKTYYGAHNCQKEWVLKRCSANWLASKYTDSFRANDKMSITSFGRTVQKDWNLTPSRSKLARARRLIMKSIHGDEVLQFNSLWDYGTELRRSNPGSSFYLNLQGSLFSSCYMSLDACKRGFLAGCRPIICLDGCHVKTKFGGQLLTAVGMDPNDCIYPIAFAVVEVESFVTWKWFLETLKADLQIVNTFPWTIMTDKQKVLLTNEHTHFLIISDFVR